MATYFYSIKGCDEFIRRSRFKIFRQLIFKEVDNGVTERPVEVWINDVRIITSDDETSQNPVKVNQVGYHLNADKYALISGFAHKFTTPVGTILE